MPPCHRLSVIIYGGLRLYFGRLDTRYCALTLPVEAIMSDKSIYRQSLISSIIILSLLLPLQGGSILHLGFLQQNQVFIIVFSVIFSQ